MSARIGPASSAVAPERAVHLALQRDLVHDRSDAVVQAARAHSVSARLDAEGVCRPRRGVAVRLVDAARALRLATRERRELGPIDAEGEVDRGGPFLGSQHQDAVAGGMVEPLHSVVTTGNRVRGDGVGAIGVRACPRAARGARLRRLTWCHRRVVARALLFARASAIRLLRLLFSIMRRMLSDLGGSDLDNG